MGDRTALRTCPLCEAPGGPGPYPGRAGAPPVPGTAEDRPGKGAACLVDTAADDLDHDPGHLREPHVRDGAGHVPVSWDRAFGIVRREIGGLIARHGRDAVAVYAGGPVARSIAGQLYTGAIVDALGTRNLYTASTADQMPKHVSSGHMFGDPMAVPVPDLDRTGHLLMLGADPLDPGGGPCPAAGLFRRLEAVRARGGRVTVVDPRRTRAAALADEHLFIRPGTDAFLLIALVHTLFAEDLAALPGHLAGRVNGLDDLRALAVDFPPERVAPVTGVPAAVIRRTARDLAAAPRAAVYGRAGACAQAYGTLTSWLADVLNVLTGNLDRAGGAMFPRPAHAPAHRRRRPFTTGRWRSRVRGLPEVGGELPVATLADEIETPGEGQIRALIAIGDPVLSAPNGARLDRALAGLDLLVAVHPHLTDTTRHAHVVLPPPRPAENPRYVLAHRGLTARDHAGYLPPLVPPPPGRPTEAALLARLAAVAAGPDTDPAAIDETIIMSTLTRATALGGSPVHGRAPDELRKMLDPGSPAEQRLDMLLRLGPYGDGFGADPAGLTLGRLRAEHPRGLDLGPLRPRLDEVLCTTSGRVELCPPTFAADVDRLLSALRDAPPPGLLLISRRRPRPAPRTAAPCTLQLNPADADRLGIAPGAAVRVVSRTGAVEAVAEPTDALMAGVVSLPRGRAAGRPGARAPGAGAVTDDQAVDPLSGNAVLNGVPVTLELLPS